MDATIHIAEATAFIEGIHILKQWVYEGTIQLLIPQSTLTTVEEAYKKSLQVKDVPKQLQAKSGGGGRSRIQQPLFDINPRTAWEFVERARSEKGVPGVIFQKDNEVFTQWKEEEEKVTAKAETPLPPPSSFADALIRKLNIKDEKDGVKAPSKPKLTARTKETKPVWKIQKVPIFSSDGLTAAEKSLLTCMLWRIYEAEPNPLQPVKFVLLVSETELEDKATKLGILSETLSKVKERVADDKKLNDHRTSKGLLEETFPKRPSSSQTLTNGFGEETYITNEIVATRAAAAESEQLSKVTDEQCSSVADPDHPTTNLDASRAMTASMQVKGSQTSTISELPEQIALSASNPVDVINTKEDDIDSADATLTKSDFAQTELDNTLPVKAKTPSPRSNTPQDSESELESDEEIIVFNPRNRRTSGLQGSRSRPGSSSGFIQRTYKAGVQTNSRPTMSTGLASLDGEIESMRDIIGHELLPSSLLDSIEHPDTPSSVTEASHRIPLESKLKAQSPVFTPGQPFLPAAQGSSPVTRVPGSPVRDAPTGPRNVLPRHQRALNMRQDNSEEMMRMQRENSQRIIQRQREAIQRQSELANKTGNTATPRVVQMEPTDSPTIIDPNAYDRSYVVQPIAKAAASGRQHHEKRRSRGNHSHGNSRSSPKPEARAPEPDIDYVLKSGTPRGSMRGKGKLWVP